MPLDGNCVVLMRNDRHVVIFLSLSLLLAPFGSYGFREQDGTDANDLGSVKEQAIHPKLHTAKLNPVPVPEEKSTAIAPPFTKGGKRTSMVCWL